MGGQSLLVGYVKESWPGGWETCPTRPRRGSPTDPAGGLFGGKAMGGWALVAALGLAAPAGKDAPPKADGIVGEWVVQS